DVAPEASRDGEFGVAAERARALAEVERGAEEGGDRFVPDIARIDAGAGGDAGHLAAGPREHSADGCGQIARGREVRNGRHPRREGVGESALIRAACDLLESEAVRMVHGDSTTAPCRARGHRDQNQRKVKSCGGNSRYPIPGTALWHRWSRS